MLPAHLKLLKLPASWPYRGPSSSAYLPHLHILPWRVQVWTWGEPWGDFSMKVDRSPKSVAGATDIVKIACGAFHNLCLNG